MPSTVQSQDPPARFLVLEGLDGAGTTTLAGMLAEALQGRDLRVRLTAEPTDGPFGQLLRRHVRHEVTLDESTAALVFTADRADHLASMIRPALARGRTVVCDRYLLSTLAYQGASGVDPETVLGASEGFEKPDITFFLDAPHEVRAGRMADRASRDRYEEPGVQGRLEASYLSAIELLRSHGHRIDVIDAGRRASEVLDAILVRLDSGD
jgi:dTMP kinase